MAGKLTGLVVRPGHEMHGAVASVDGGAVLLNTDASFSSVVALPGRRFIVAGREFLVWVEDESGSNAIVSALIDAEPAVIRQIETLRLVPRREA